MTSLSIVCVSYNHEKYIRQTMDGFLNQKTTFPYTIIIGDDASTDGTARLISRYARKYPKKIVPILRKKNVGGPHNFTHVLSQVTSPYIAICEGDDYWTDPTKLQRQVDYLEAHPDCAACFHDASVLDQKTHRLVKRLRIPSKRRLYYTKDLLMENLIPTLTCVFRNHLPKPLPSWFTSVYPGDWPLHIFNSLHGYTYYMPRDMAVYRRHDQGITHSLHFDDQHQRMIEMLLMMSDTYLDYTYRDYIHNGVSRLKNNLAEYYSQTNQRKIAWKVWIDSLLEYPMGTPFTPKRRLATLIQLVKSYLPQSV